MMGRPMGGGMPFGQSGDKSKNFKGTTARLFKRLGRERLKLVLALVLGSVSVAFTVIGPRILGDATNVLFNGIVGKQIPKHMSKAQIIAELKAHGQGQIASMISSMNIVPGAGFDFNKLGSLLGFAALVYALGALFSFFQGYIMAGVTQRTMYRLRQDVEVKLSKLPLKYFDSTPHGDILSRVTNDIDNLSTTLQQGLGQLLSSVLTIVGVMGMMFYISPTLAAVSVLVVPMALAITFFIAKKSQVNFRSQWKRTGTLNGLIEETHSGHSLVQVFGQRERINAEFDVQNKKLYEASFRAQFLSGVIQPSMQILSNLNYVVIAVLGGYRVASGTLSLGDVQAFIQYSRQFTMPITQIASQMNMLQSGIASAERVFQFLDQIEEEPENHIDRVLLPSPLKGTVDLDKVNFSYELSKPLIKDFSLKVEDGKTVAIVGPTGAGKTTIVNLLVRFYEIQSGKLKLDGVNYTNLTRDEVRQAYGMVLQDAWLFSGTIWDNIAYGKLSATDQEITSAAKAAFVDHFVQTLPDGYQTVISSEFNNISSGQRQLLTIARAFLADPPILILDEATSNVDTRTEVLIQEAMSKLRKNRTSFVIAHRLSTIREADIIIVMEHGEIVEHGSHQELLDAKGAYFRLYSSQLQNSSLQ